MTALSIAAQAAQPGSLWLAWNADPTALIGIPLAAILYARGLRSLGKESRFHGTWRPFAFYAGLFTVFIALVSPVDRLAGDLFLMHMVQHELLMLVAVPLMLLGAPMIPIMRGIPRPTRQRLVIPVAKSLPVRSILRTLASPLIAWPLFVIVFFGWHLPPWYGAAQTSDFVHICAHVSLTAVAGLFWWNIIDPLPLKPNLSNLGRIPYIFLMTIPNLALSAFVTFSDTAWYPIHELRAPLHGLTAMEDQQIGGAIMWIPGSFIMAAALLINLWLVVRNEENGQRAQERLQGQNAG